MSLDWADAEAEATEGSCGTLSAAQCCIASVRASLDLLPALFAWRVRSTAVFR